MGQVNYYRVRGGMNQAKITIGNTAADKVGNSF